MSIGADAMCFQCHMNRYLETARKHGDEKTATAFARELMQLYIDLPEDAGSPELTPKVTELLTKYYGLDPDRMRPEKEASNRFVLERLPQIQAMVETAEDPLYAALQFAVLGNYLDFSALQGKVSFQQLEQMLLDGLQLEIDKTCYEHFRQDLANGQKVLILTDNAGEIGFDRVFAQQIKKAFPHAQITFCVRGGPALNDATREDAAFMQIEFPVIDNGSAISATVLSILGQEAKEAMDSADVIIAKGMANTETLYGSGYPVYFAFLVKCNRIKAFFNKPMMTPMFVKDPNCNK